MNIRKSKGFTLIELMITVAIVGVLAAVALPAYQDYTIRAQMTEAVILASGGKATIEEWYAQTGKLPSDHFEADVRGNVGKYVDMTDIQPGNPGMIFSRLGGATSLKAANYSIFLKARINTTSGQLTWECIGNMPRKWLPSSCTQHDTPQTLS